MWWHHVQRTVLGEFRAAAGNFEYFAGFSVICSSEWGNSWRFRQGWHYGTSAARLLSCNCGRWWQMCAMTYQKNSHSYILFSYCNLKYWSKQECFGHVQPSELSWFDGQKQQNHKLKTIMDDILTVHATRGQTNNTPVSSPGRNITVRCHSAAKKIQIYRHRNIHLCLVSLST